MLDETIIDYIFKYYSYLMNLNEAGALKHHVTSYKFRNNLSSENANESKKFLIEKGWLSNKQEELKLLENDFDFFKQKVVERILRDHSEKILYNYCPKCGKLARTPYAKQCRYCYSNWH